MTSQARCAIFNWHTAVIRCGVSGASLMDSCWCYSRSLTTLDCGMDHRSALSITYGRSLIFLRICATIYE